MPELLAETKKAQNNIMLASIFSRMADCYRYLGKEERFRANAYENVAKTLLNMKGDIAAYAGVRKTLSEIGGIGESIAEKILEFLHTGKIETFEKLKKKLPIELLDLMNISGIGPSTLKLLHDKFHVSNREELVGALLIGKLKRVKGFGEKRIDNIKRALKLFKSDKRMLLNDAEKIGNQLIEDIRKIPNVQRAELAGSLRRKKETVGDIDIIILAKAKARKKMIDQIIKLPPVSNVLVKGITKISFILKPVAVQVDIRIVQDYEFGAAMLYFTGSRQHTIKLRSIAREMGYKLNEYGLFDKVSEKRLAGSEEEIYRFLNMKFIPPEQRNDTGEIEKAEWKDHLVLTH